MKTKPVDLGPLPNNLRLRAEQTDTIFEQEGQFSLYPLMKHVYCRFPILHTLRVLSPTALQRVPSFRNEQFFAGSRKSRDYAEAYEGTSPK